MAKSIIAGGNEKRCWICEKLGYETTRNLEKHHIIYGRGRRDLSEHWGLHVKLCYIHHGDSKHGVHRGNTEWNRILKETAQRAFEEQKGTREEFIRIFGENYL